MSETVDIAIIGAGFSGLGLAVRLREQGVEDFVILERNADVGGTWWANTYPGCACDVPSHLYSFSFAPNPDWSRTTRRSPRSGPTSSASRASATSTGRSGSAPASPARTGTTPPAAGRLRPRAARSPPAC